MLLQRQVCPDLVVQRGSRTPTGPRSAKFLYPWHPWAGRIVDVREVIEKASGCVARCRLDGEAAHRSLKLPAWMLDRVAVAPMRMDAHPWVDIAALDALTTLPE